MNHATPKKKTPSGFSFCLFAFCLFLSGCGEQAASEPSEPPPLASGAGVAPEALSAEPDHPLYAIARPASRVPVRPAHVYSGAEPIVVPGCTLAVVEKQEVPSQQGGIIRLIGSEVGPGESVPPDRLIVVAGDPRKFRRLVEGDTVQAGQLVALLDDRLARHEVAIKHGRVLSARADLAAADKTREEAKHRYETEARLGTASSAEAVRGAKLVWERYTYEAIIKQEAVHLAELELAQAQTLLEMHAIRATIPGVIKEIHKSPGEAVQSQESVMVLNNPARLRACGLVDAGYEPRLRLGMKVLIEPSRLQDPERVLIGHLDTVTAVAVGRGPKQMVVSASADGSVRVRDQTSRQEICVWPHPKPVLAIACSPAGATMHWCLSGAADGVARLWDFASARAEPARQFRSGHQGAITCAAFSPDGRFAATGGEDHAICIWDTLTGMLRYRLPVGHRAAVTSVEFTPRAQLVSAGRDNTLRLWALAKDEARLAATFDQRAGDVIRLGVGPDGSRALFDQGGMLQLLLLPTGLTDGIVQDAAGKSQFSSFAQFSPDGRLILTAADAGKRVHLWLAPAERNRGYEVRELVLPKGSIATCGAFAPDGTFVVIGTRDRQVLVWSMPPADELEQLPTAEITLLEKSVSPAARQMRIWAELSNPGGLLLSGTTANMAIYPPK